jgi:hypothetical protein
MDTADRVRDLITKASYYWAGEAEVVRTYWNSSVRSTETDMLWLARQCFKEFWGGGVSWRDKEGLFVGNLKTILAQVPEIDKTVDRDEIRDALEGTWAEFSHYCAFADAYDAIRPAGSPKLNPSMLSPWPEEDRITALRHKHQADHGAIGLRACKFTEGGFCTLFSEGMAVKGRGGTYDLIADACKKVYEDEFDHMLIGIADIHNENYGDAEWDLLWKLSEQQLQHRIPLRNEQFSKPLTEKRIQEIYEGKIDPLPIAPEARKRLGI